MWQPNKLEQERLEKLAQLEAAGVKAYPARVERTQSNAQALAALEAYEAKHPGEDTANGTPITVTVCGRIRRVNVKGKISFLHIEDETARIQLFLRVNDMDEAVYNTVKDKLVEMDDINPDLPQADVVLVIGANDVVNPAARHDKTSPIYGMPIIDADKARTCFAIKRSMNPGFAGIENELYYADRTYMLFGDAKAIVGELVKSLSGVGVH